MDIDEEDDVDEHGNIKDLIDYSYDKKIKKKRKKTRQRNKQSLSISDFIRIMVEQHYNRNAVSQPVYIISSPKNKDAEESEEVELSIEDKPEPDGLSVAVIRNAFSLPSLDFRTKLKVSSPAPIMLALTP